MEHKTESFVTFDVARKVREKCSMRHCLQRGHPVQGLEYLEATWACTFRRKAQKWRTELAFINLI